MDDLTELYKGIWASVLKKIKDKTPIFQENEPIQKSWIYSGGSNGKYTMVLTQKRALVKLEFTNGKKEIAQAK